MGRDGSGVSIGQTQDGTWRVRWRDASGKQRQRNFKTKAEALRQQAEAEESREEGRKWLPEVTAAKVEIGTAATVAGILAGWLTARRTSGRVSEATLQTFGVRSARVLRTLRAMHGLSEADPVSVAVLTRKTAIDMVAYLRTAPRAPRKGTAPGEGKPRRGTGKLLRPAQTGPISQDAIVQTVSCLLDAWAFAAGDPATYPGVPAAPSATDREIILPAPQDRGAADAPTLAELDAAIRRMGGSTQVLAVIQRFTGLRIDQTMAIEVRDLDVERRILHVRTGKTKAEKRGRFVPVSAHLVEWLRPHLAGLGPEDRIGGRKGRHPDLAYTAAWELATQAGEARRETWAPPGRAARPTHAFRAAVLAHLDSADVPSKVMAHLAGHATGAQDASEALRGRHYVPPIVERSRAAVDALPPIDWTGPRMDQPGNVVPLRNAR